MRHHHRTRCAAVLVAALAIAPLAEAQMCQVTLELSSDLRRLTGTVMTECGGECILLWCEKAPWGNFGVNSDFSRRRNTNQFRGWHPDGSKREWNACTQQYYGGPYVNDGAGQKAAPDDERLVGSRAVATSNRGVSCREYLPEVHTAEDVDMAIYEMDRITKDDYITTLDYGDIDIRITCTSNWVCSGTSEWHEQEATNSAGVSARVRVWLSGRVRY